MLFRRIKGGGNNNEVIDDADDFFNRHNLNRKTYMDLCYEITDDVTTVVRKNELRQLLIETYLFPFVDYAIDKLGTDESTKDKYTVEIVNTMKTESSVIKNQTNKEKWEKDNYTTSINLVSLQFAVLFEKNYYILHKDDLDDLDDLDDIIEYHQFIVNNYPTYMNYDVMIGFQEMLFYPYGKINNMITTIVSIYTIYELNDFFSKNVCLLSVPTEPFMADGTQMSPLRFIYHDCIHHINYRRCVNETKELNFPAMYEYSKTLFFKNEEFKYDFNLIYFMITHEYACAILLDSPLNYNFFNFYNSMFWYNGTKYGINRFYNPNDLGNSFPENIYVKISQSTKASEKKLIVTDYLKFCVKIFLLILYEYLKKTNSNLSEPKFLTDYQGMYDFFVNTEIQNLSIGDIIDLTENGTPRLIEPQIDPPRSRENTPIGGKKQRKTRRKLKKPISRNKRNPRKMRNTRNKRNKKR